MPTDFLAIVRRPTGTPKPSTHLIEVYAMLPSDLSFAVGMPQKNTRSRTPAKTDRRTWCAAATRGSVARLFVFHQKISRTADGERRGHVGEGPDETRRFGGRSGNAHTPPRCACFQKKIRAPASENAGGKRYGCGQPRPIDAYVIDSSAEENPAKRARPS